MMIWIMLSLVVSRNWSIDQLEVSNAFLHGFLDEEVFMQKPAGFVSKEFPTHVCNLCCSIYGLKQSPRAWFHRLRDYVLKLGFTKSIGDHSLFLFDDREIQAYFLIYVDDIILTSLSDAFISSVTSSLADEFVVKDLGHLHLFLGVQVDQAADGSLFLTQSQYVQNLFKKVNLSNVRPVNTPLDLGMDLYLDVEPSDDLTLFRQVVGSLQYLITTWSNLAFAVNKILQFKQNLSTIHWQALKRVL